MPLWRICCADQSTVSLDLLWRNVQDRCVEAQQPLSRRVPQLGMHRSHPTESEELQKKKHDKIANPQRPIYNMIIYHLCFIYFPVSEQ